MINKSSASIQHTATAPHKISFIIASVDRDQELQECIASIEKAHEYNQDIPVEILVVIQKSKEEKKILVRYPEMTFFYYIDKMGLSAARNFAIAKSRGDYLVFLDDDAAVKEDFIGILAKKVIEYNNVDAFCGRLTDSGRNIPFSVLFRNGNIKRLHRWNYQYFMGSAHILSKKVIKKIGLYDERFGVGAKYRGSEESDIFFRLKATNEQVIYLPDLNFYHPVIFASCSYVYNYGYAFGAVLTKHFICDSRYFFIYLFIALEIITKAYIRLLQKTLLQGKYSEKDEKYHYSDRLRGFFEGIRSFVSNNYMRRRGDD